MKADTNVVELVSSKEKCVILVFNDCGDVVGCYGPFASCQSAHAWADSVKWPEGETVDSVFVIDPTSV